MKNKFLILTLVAAGALSFSFRTLPDDDAKAKATVTKKEGMYIFLQAKPEAPNQYLGSVKKSLAWTGKPEEMLNAMIKKVKKEYPAADGIIFTDIDMDQADAIKFQ